MSIAFIADCHFHPFPEFGKIVDEGGLPVNSRLKDQLDTFRNVCTLCKERGVKALVIAGDLFHTRGVIPVDVHQFVYSVIRWVKHDLGIDVVLLSGNHDQMDEAGDINSIYGFRDIALVVDKPCTLNILGVSIGFVPFISNKTVLQAALSNVKGDFLVAHCGVDGAAIGPVEYRIKDPITLGDLGIQDHRWVLLGHYHKPQRLSNNAMYIGSPWQIDRAEMGDKKRFLVYNPVTRSMRSIQTGGKEFHSLNSSELVVAESLEPGYYDIHSTSIETVEEIHEAVERLGLESYKTHPVPKSVTHKARIASTESMSDQQLLQAYVLYKKGDLGLEDVGLQALSRVSKGTYTRLALAIDQIVVENFMGIGEAELRMDSPGSVIGVLGKSDVAGYTSNGSSKSSLLPESVFWCLYGETARNLPADKVINSFCKRNCRVEIRLRIDRHVLIVTRYRKHNGFVCPVTGNKIQGSGLRLVLDGVDVTLGTPTMTDQRLSQILGLDMDTFSSVIAFSPDTLRFVSSTDSRQKHVLDSILQTRRFSLALEDVKGLLKESRKRLSEMLQEKSVKEGVKEVKVQQLEQYNTLNREFSSKEQQKRARLSLDREAAEMEAGHLRQLINKQVGLVSQVEEELKASRFLELSKSIQENSKKIGASEQQLKTLRQNRDNTQKALDEANEQVGKPCSKCGQPVTNLGKLISGYQQEMQVIIKAGKLCKGEVVALREQETALVAVATQLQGLNTKLTELRRGKSTYEVSLKQQEGIIRGIDCALAEESDNKFPGLIQDTQLLLTSIDHCLAGMEQAIYATEQEISVLEFWVEAFGNGGIRSFLLDQILPDLTAYANEYSEQLTGGTINIEFKTFTEGSVKDKFQIIAINEEGADLYVGNSSGEKRRIDLCVMFALFRIAHSRTRVNIMLLDETLDSIDKAGLENVIPLLKRMAEELQLTIFVTSHHPVINSQIHESVTLIKKGGVSNLKALLEKSATIV